eukprot:4973148-Prorocentrum_lima.AAC.1
MVTPKENKEEKEEGPWEEPLTVSGARSSTKHSSLPGFLQGTPCLLQAGQVWDAFDVKTSKEKTGLLSAK